MFWRPIKPEEPSGEWYWSIGCWFHTELVFNWHLHSEYIAHVLINNTLDLLGCQDACWPVILFIFKTPLQQRAPVHTPAIGIIFLDCRWHVYTCNYNFIYYLLQTHAISWQSCMHVLLYFLQQIKSCEQMMKLIILQRFFSIPTCRFNEENSHGRELLGETR